MLKSSLPLSMPGDSLEMTEAVAVIRKRTKRVTRKTKYQLKIGVINYYPERGTVHLDNGPTLLKGGIDILTKIIDRPHARLEQVLATCGAIEGVLPSSYPGITMPVEL